ncbi:hypothetical protein D3C71_2115500 [compost metagenome]
MVDRVGMLFLEGDRRRQLRNILARRMNVSRAVMEQPEHAVAKRSRGLRVADEQNGLRQNELRTG